MALSETETHDNKPPSPTSTRPPRKRKAVQRFPIEALPRRSATRKILICQGYGTPLKDIPNVAFKLSKRKTDDNILLLHVILYGKKAKTQMVKKNLGLFSGFLWVEEEEKQRSKVRKKLDQCVKATLLDFCNILDIPVNKSTVKKEDLPEMVLKFLESPHPTTETLLADKEKTKKLTHNSRVGAKRQQSKSGEEDKKSECSTGEDEEGNDSEEDREVEQATHMGIRPAVKNIYLKECGNSKTRVKGHLAKSPKPTSKKRSSSSSSKEGISEAETESKASVAKKQKVEKKSNKYSEAKTESKSSSVKTSSKKNASIKSPVKAKMIGKGKNHKNVEAEVTREELHSVLFDILKKADLNTVTLADILVQLGVHFNTDLSHRKAEVRALITDIINNMMDEDEEPDTGNHTDNEDDNDTYYD